MKYSIKSAIDIDVKDYAEDCLNEVNERITDNLTADWGETVATEAEDIVMVDVLKAIICEAEERLKTYENIAEKYHSSVIREIEEEEED